MSRAELCFALTCTGLHWLQSELFFDYGYDKEIKSENLHKRAITAEWMSDRKMANQISKNHGAVLHGKEAQAASASQAGATAPASGSGRGAGRARRGRGRSGRARGTRGTGTGSRGSGKNGSSSSVASSVDAGLAAESDDMLLADSAFATTDMAEQLTAPKKRRRAS